MALNEFQILKVVDRQLLLDLRLIAADCGIEANAKLTLSFGSKHSSPIAGRFSDLVNNEGPKTILEAKSGMRRFQKAASETAEERG